MRAMTAGLVCLCSIGAGAFAQDRPSLQDATNRVRSAGAVDDSDALRKLWGPPQSGAPEDPDAPTSPPVPDAPFAPCEWLVIDGGCDAVATIQGFVTRMLIVREQAPVAGTMPLRGTTRSVGSPAPRTRPERSTLPFALASPQSNASATVCGWRTWRVPRTCS